MDIKIIGTGHILEKSVERVREAIFENRPDIVAIELCERRFQVIESQGAEFYLDYEPHSIWSIFSEVVGGGSLLVFLGGLLALIQQEFGKRYGIPPGSDMFSAIRFSKEIGASIVLVDRDIEVTFNHLVNIPFREIVKLVCLGEDEAMTIGNLFDNNINQILEEENIKQIMSIIRRVLPTLYSALIDERDQYMAIALHTTQRSNPEKRILAVVGAGHKRGIIGYLNELKRGECRSDVNKLNKAYPVSKLRILALSFIIFLAYMLTKVRSWIIR